MSGKICDISEDVRKSLKDFRFNKDTKNRALICKFFDGKQKKLVNFN